MPTPLRPPPAGGAGLNPSVSPQATAADFQGLLAALASEHERVVADLHSKLREKAQEVVKQADAERPTKESSPVLDSHSEIIRKKTRISTRQFSFATMRSISRMGLGDRPEDLECDGLSSLASDPEKEDTQRNLTNYLFAVEPSDTSWTWSSFVTNIYFELFVCIAIIANTVCTACALQVRGMQTAPALEFRNIGASSSGRLPNVEEFLDALEMFFLAFFTVEMCLRCAILRYRLFRSPMNLLDFIIILMGILERFLTVAALGGPLTLRLLRLFRLVRGFSMRRVGNKLVTVRFLVRSIIASFPTLLWSLCVLFLFQTAAAMVLTTLLYEYIDNDTNPWETRTKIYAYYGTTTRAFFTMFEATLANFAPPCRLLVDNVSEAYSLFFVAYRCLVGFAFINVISAMFVQKTLKAAQEDHEALIKKQEDENKMRRAKLEQFFLHLDTSGDGILSWAEFQAALGTDKTLNWLKVLGIDPFDLKNLFQLLDDGDGCIQLEEFIVNMSRLSGAARSMDILFLLKGLQNLEERLAAADGKSLVEATAST